ncbi:MAG: hypothetical protein Q9169_008159 [Polycauliona sp. 2 TL-2023]
MATTDRSKAIAQLLTNCNFSPDPAKLKEDPKCHICFEDCLGCLGSEMPVELKRCHHILGLTCLVIWVFEQTENAGTPSPGCPCCRAPLWESSDTAARSEMDEEVDVSYWLQGLNNWTPGGDDQWPGDGIWIKRAEDLWTELCDKILDDLDQPDFSGGVAAELEDFLCRKGLFSWGVEA